MWAFLALEALILQQFLVLMLPKDPHFMTKISFLDPTFTTKSGPKPPCSDITAAHPTWKKVECPLPTRQSNW